MKALEATGRDTAAGTALLEAIEGGEKWWRALQAGERARRDDVQARFDAFQRREAVVAYLGAGAFTAGLLVLAWLLMAW